MDILATAGWPLIYLLIILVVSYAGNLYGRRAISGTVYNAIGSFAEVAVRFVEQVNPDAGNVEKQRLAIQRVIEMVEEFSGVTVSDSLTSIIETIVETAVYEMKLDREA